MLSNCPNCGYFDARLKCDYCGYVHDNHYFENSNNQLLLGTKCPVCNKGNLCEKGTIGNP